MLVFAAAVALALAASPAPLRGEVAWRADLPGTPLRPCAAVTTTRGEVIVLQGLANGHLVAVSSAARRSDGSKGAKGSTAAGVLWDEKLGRGGWHATPSAVDVDGLGSVVIAGAFDGPAVAVDVETGAVKWRAAMDGVLGAAVVSDDIVFVGTVGGVVALDADTGYERGRFRTQGGVPAVAALGGKVIFESFWDGALIAADVEAVGGYVFFHELWRLRGPALEHDAHGNVTRTAGFQAEALPIDDGVAYVPTNVAELWAVDVGTGKKRWGYEPGGAVINAPAFSRGTLYVSATNGTSVDASRRTRVAAVDAGTGVERWAVDLPHTLAMGGPIVVGERVVVADDAKALLAFDAESGERALSVALPGAAWWAACADRDGTVYVADEKRHLTAIR